MILSRKMASMKRKMLAEAITEESDLEHPNWDLLDLVVKYGSKIQDKNRKPGINIDGTEWPLWYGEIQLIKGEDFGWRGDNMFLDLFIGHKGTNDGVSGLCIREKDVKVLAGFTPEDFKKFEEWLPNYWKDAKIIMR